MEREKIVEAMARGMIADDHASGEIPLRARRYRDQAQAALTAIEALGLVVSQGWQDIASAPRDGTDVLVMYMHIDTQCVFNAFYASAEQGWDDEDCGWWSYEHSEVSRIKLEGWMKPSHWMPLPAAPQGRG